MVVETDHRKVFPFFDLPRELRDVIYDETLESQEVELECALIIEVKDRAPLNLLLTSHQLKGELEDRAIKKIEVHINDTEHVNADDTCENSQFPMPTAITKVRTINVVLMADDLSYFQMHRAWVFKLLHRFTSLQQLRVKCGIQESYGMAGLDKWPRELLENGWISLPDITQHAAQLHQPQHLPFFDLPRELRDTIYDEALENREDQELSCHLYLKPKNVPNTNALLISKQFKQEYEERAQKHSSLIIRDVRFYRREFPAFPEAAKKVSSILFEPCLDEIDLGASVGRYRPLIRAITSERFNLKAFSVRFIIGLDPGDDHDVLGLADYPAEEWVRRLGQDGWTDIPNLTGLLVLDTGKDYDDVSEGKEKIAKVVGEWKGSGKFQALSETRDELVEGVIIPFYVEKEKRMQAALEEFRKQKMEETLHRGAK